MDRAQHPSSQLSPHVILSGIPSYWKQQVGFSFLQISDEIFPPDFLLIKSSAQLSSNSKGYRRKSDFFQTVSFPFSQAEWSYKRSD